MIITVSNLFPRPDQPTRGMFNLQLFREMAANAGIQNPEGRSQNPGSINHFLNICLVPEWRVWKWPMIRRWKAPRQTADHRLQTADPVKEGEGGGESHEGRPDVCGLMSVVYLPVLYLPLIGRSINWWFYCRALRCAFSKFVVCGLSSAVSCPMVLASWLYPDAVAAARLARELGVPVWLRVHGTDRYHLKNRYRRGLILDAVDYAQGVICNCKAVADDLVKWGVPARKIHIVPNGVDTSLFRYRNKAELLGCQAAKLLRGQKNGGNGLNSLTAEQLSNSQLILFIGNLVPVKGPDVMLHAFAELVRNEVQVAADVPAADGQSSREVVRRDVERHLEVTLPRLLLIGSGPMRAQLERLTKDLNISHRVHFLGNRPHEEVALWMNVADVLCLTSRSEGMPNVVLEALAARLPVVATDVGGCRDLLAESAVSQVCRVGDVAGIAESIKTVLLLNPDRFAVVQRQGSQGSWEKRARELLNVVYASSCTKEGSDPL